MQPREFDHDLLLLERIAAGGMGEVFRAQLLGAAGFEKIVALKRMLPHFAASPNLKAMFEREMKLCANLHHPNIVQVYRNGEFDGYLYLVMEYVEGRDVAQISARVRDHNLTTPVQFCVYIAAEIAKGLEYAHHFRNQLNGEVVELIHRDISPHNLLISYQGEVKLVDFGIAKIAGKNEMTKPGDFRGKLGYVSPEQAQGEPLDGRSDIFSLAVVLYEMLTNRTLFASNNTYATLKKIISGEIPQIRAENPHIPDELAAILEKALARDRNKRQRTAGEFYRDLTLFLNRNFPSFIPAELGDFLSYLFLKDIEDTTSKRRAQSAAIEGVKANRAQSRAVDPGPLGQRTVVFSHDAMPELAPPPQMGDANGGVSRSYTRLRFAFLALAFVSAMVTAFIIGKPHTPARTNNPAPIPGEQGLLAAFEPDRLTLPSGSKVSLIGSTTGTISASQLNIDAQPILMKNVINGHAVLHFDGVNDWLQADSLADQAQNFPTLSIITVGRSNLDRIQYFWSLQEENPDYDVLRLGFVPNNRIRLKVSRVVAVYEDLAPTDIGTPAIYSMIFQAGRASVYRNGELFADHVGDLTVKLASMRHFSIGQEYDGIRPSDFLAGDIAELRAYLLALSSSQRSAIEHSLAEKYGIALQQ